jgi:DNA-binding transcriptional regulator YdaS (Cro superfamily)
MELRVYLALKRIPVRDFAKLLDYTPSYISQLKNGHRKPGKRTAKYIELMTNGQVKFEENDVDGD